MYKTCSNANGKSLGRFTLSAIGLSLFALIVAISHPAQAQLQLQIGGSEAEFKALLAQQGYDRIDTRKIGLSSSIFQACKGDKRYQIKFEWTGQASRKVIGNCRIVMAEDSIRQLLRDRGYRRITIEDRAGKYLAVGCQGNERFRAELNYYGDITKERRIGRCQEELSPADITAQLETRGYNRIRFTDRQLPQYVAEACLNDDKFQLDINRFGEIASSARIGNCQARVTPDQITGLMKEKGFTRVKVIDDQLPRYIAEGCRDAKRFEVTLNRWGETANEVFLRPCRNAFSSEQIKVSMRDNGYTNVSVIRDSANFVAKGCRDNRYMEIILSSFGELVSRRELGSCDAPRINDLAETLRGRGLDNLKFYVEGCRNGSQVRITFDEFANRLARDVVGGC